MKKAISLLCTLAMILLCACGGSEGASTGSTTTGGETSLAELANGNGEDTASDEDVTLRIYIRYSDDDTMLPYDYAVEQLAQQYPHVTLELDPMPADDGVKIKSYAATGDMPDIYGVSGMSLIGSLLESGNMADLTEAATAAGFVDKVRTSAESKLYHPDDGRIYTLPYTGSEVVLLFINRDLFEQHDVKVPETIDEWIEAARAFSAQGITPLPLHAKEKYICVAFYDMLVTRFEPLGLTGLDNGSTSIHDDAYLQAAQSVLDLAEAGLFPMGVTNLNYEQATSLWYEGQAAMLVNGQWEIATATEQLGDSADWIPIPAATAEAYGTSQYAFSGGYGTPAGLSVSPTSEHFDLAVEVAMFMAEKYAEYNHIYRGSTAVALNIDRDVEVELQPMMEKLAEYMPKVTSTTMLGSVTDTNLNATLQDECQRLVAGEVTAEEFIENVARVMD